MWGLGTSTPASSAVRGRIVARECVTRTIARRAETGGAHDTACGVPSTSNAVELHVAPEPGPPPAFTAAATFELANALPPLSSATHEPPPKHETVMSPRLGSINRECQVEAPPVGSVLRSAWPSSSTATHSALEAQETPTRLAAIATGADQAPGVAIAGLVLKSRAPLASTATHSALEAQETEVSAVVPSIVTADQAPGPAAGSVLTTAWPSSSTATHSVVEGHATEVSARPPSTANPDQDPAVSSAGRAPITARPASSTATQRAAEGHAIARREWPPSTSTGPDQRSDGAPAAGMAAIQAPQQSRARNAGRTTSGWRCTSDATHAPADCCAVFRDRPFRPHRRQASAI